MIPDLYFLREKYGIFNDEFFGGELPEVKILLSDAKNFLGNIRYKVERQKSGKIRRYDYVIRISRVYDREQHEIEDTLIHEMIHLYIASNYINDTSSHGVEFRKIMNRINRDFGRNIIVSHRSTRDGEIKMNGGSRHWHVVAVVKLNDGKQGFKVIPRVSTTIVKFRDSILTSPSVKEVEFFLTDNPYFHKFPNSVSLRVHIMGETEINRQLINSTKIKIKH